MLIFVCETIYETINGKVTDLHGTVCPAVLVCEPVSQSREGSIVIKVNITNVPNYKKKVIHLKIYITDS